MLVLQVLKTAFSLQLKKKVCHDLYSKCSMSCSCIAFWSTEDPDSQEIGTYPEGPSGIFSFDALTSKPDIYSNKYIAEG